MQAWQFPKLILSYLSCLLFEKMLLSYHNTKMVFCITHTRYLCFSRGDTLIWRCSAAPRFPRATNCIFFGFYQFLAQSLKWPPFFVTIVCSRCVLYLLLNFTWRFFHSLVGVNKNLKKFIAF